MINKHDVVREMTNPTVKTEVTVYSKTPCGGCDFTKNWLDEHNIAYKTVEDADQDSEVMDQMRKHGYMGFPVVTVGSWDNGWSGINLNRLEGLL